MIKKSILAALLAIGVTGSSIAETEPPSIGVQADVFVDDMAASNRERVFIYDFNGSGNRVFGDIFRFQHSESGNGPEDMAGLRIPLKSSAYTGNLRVFGINSENQSGAGFDVYGSSGPVIIGWDTDVLDSEIPLKGGKTKDDRKILFGPIAGFKLNSNIGKTCVAASYHDVDGQNVYTLFGMHTTPDMHDIGIALSDYENGSRNVTVSLGHETTEIFKGSSWRLTGSTDTDKKYSGVLTAAWGPHMHFQPLVIGKVNPIDGGAAVRLFPSIMDFPDIRLYQRGNKAALDFSYDHNGDIEGVKIAGSAYPLSMAGQDVNRINPHVDLEYTNGDLYPKHKHWKAGAGVVVDLSDRGLYRKTDADDAIDFSFSLSDSMEAAFYASLRKVF